MKGRRFPRVICADGFNMSVQAHDFYCSPRENNAEKYKEVEIPVYQHCEDRNDTELSTLMFQSVL